MYNYEELNQAVIDGIVQRATELTQRALDDDQPVEDIMNMGLARAMEVVGKKYESGEFFIPEMLLAARAMRGGLDLLRPHLAKGGGPRKGKVIIGTVQGDLHDLGKNIVGALFEGAGYEVVDLGVDVEPQRFVKAIQDYRPVFVLMSALLTTTMERMATSINLLVESGVRESVKIGIGGAPVTQAFADEIGADFYAPDAARAVVEANLLV